MLVHYKPVVNKCISWIRLAFKKNRIDVPHGWNSQAVDHYPIRDRSQRSATQTEEYWNDVLVNYNQYVSVKESLSDLEKRFEIYPYFRELMGLWGSHNDEVILDYGCGPGNDLVGFLHHTKAKKVIGMDVSLKGLKYAQQRLFLHRFDPARVELIKISDAIPKTPLDDSSVDYIYCEGVLHHTSYPEEILKEFYRIIKPQGEIRIMVYNYDSLWLHLFTAYVRMVLQNAFPGLNVEEAFTKNTDGENCPVSRCYRPAVFCSLCHKAGFKVNYLGGYLSQQEMNIYHTYGEQALSDERFSEEHKTFLKNLTFGPMGYPVYQGKYAGIGGVYQLHPY